MKTVVVTSVTGEPITLEEVKWQLRLEPGNVEEDEYLTSLIGMSRQRVESITGRRLMPQTWKAYHDEWPAGDRLELPLPPLRSMASSGFTYKNSTGATTVFSSSSWDLDIYNEGYGEVVLKDGESWPSGNLYTANPISVSFNCGYASRAAIPAEIKHASHLMVSNFYENREPYMVGVGYAISKFPMSINTLLTNYRVGGFK